MVDIVTMDIEIVVPATVEPAGDMPDKWAEGLTTNAERINDRRIAKVPDSGSFNSKVAAPSSVGFAPMIDPTFVSKKGKTADNVTRSQYKNLAAGFNKWNDKLALQFATVDGVVAKRFKDQVNNSKNNWADAVARKTLRATGDKIRGTFLGQSLFWMTGDNLANQMTNSLTVVGGAPDNFTAAGLRSAFKAAGMQLLTQALILILDADFLAAEIAAQNDKLVALANGMSDALYKPFVEGGGPTDSLFQFEYADPTLILHARNVLI